MVKQVINIICLNSVKEPENFEVQEYFYGLGMMKINSNLFSY